VYQTLPSTAGETSWGCEPAGTANSSIARLIGDGGPDGANEGADEADGGVEPTDGEGEGEAADGVVGAVVASRSGDAHAPNSASVATIATPRAARGVRAGTLMAGSLPRVARTRVR
jgi:hypothetical protein